MLKKLKKKKRKSPNRAETAFVRRIHGEKESLHRNKHDFLLKLKTCQVCAACCLIIIHREFENLGENNALRKKCWIRETEEKQRRAQEAGHYRCRRWRVSGIRISLGSFRGKNSARGKDGVGSLPLQAPLRLPTAAPQLCKGSFPQIRTRGGRVSLRLVITEVAGSTQVQGLTSPRALSAGIRLHLCLSVILRESASWSVKMLHKKSLLGR